MNECSICLQTKETKEQCETCHWKSCDDCKTEWAKYNNTCPGCRAELFSKELLQKPVHRVTLRCVLKLLFIVLDIVFFFVLFDMFIMIIIGDDDCSKDINCEGYDFMVIFVVVCAVLSFRVVLRKWITECCIVNIDNAAVGFIELEEDSSEGV